ncbi:uracil-DNA glycosylase [Reichenbachiella carrageenanivorans]|uniref:Uracil-DNA glycosylase n=1 Tax=Reichenbachiella carrageenanivorans TaxID=2979869 RepID=A0ABY6CYT9_9BACT|nr:uracil-DNA glycosylase [Reichenbachiella carrageenanivorans]UXX78540.1 uracil-DNA glycosylase [Reichenbachiella carrageenanivorans]
MNVKIEKSWKSKLQAEFEAEYFKNLTLFVKSAYQGHKIFPPAGQIFRAFDLCPFDETRVVILGQDPYHGDGQAHGLCFSVQEGMRMPPSLKNIFKEIQDDLGIVSPSHGSLERWAKQGVLLLNATLTVQAHEPGSHQKQGWEEFTDAVVKVLVSQKENLVFLLWGAYAQRKGEFIDESRHYVLKSAHPSPFAAHRGFFGNKHFSKTNTFLRNNGCKEIEW